MDIGNIDNGAAASPTTPPPAPSAPTTAPAPASAPGATSNSWATATQGSASSPMPTTPGTPQAPPAPAPAQAVKVDQPPATAVPVRPGGIRGFIDKTLDSIAGTDTSRMRTDANGDLYIQHGTLTRGQQWLKIAGEGLRGAAAGLAAGKGAGNQFKGLQAGIQAEDQQEQKQTEQEKNDRLEVANSQTLKHQQAANAFTMTRLQVKAAQDDIEFSQKRADWLKGNGGTPIGHVTDLGGLAKLMRETPGFHQDQVQHDLMVPVQQYDADGKANGFEIYRMPQGYGEEVTPPGTVFHTFNPVTGKMDENKTTDWTKKSQINAYEMAAGTAAQNFALTDAEIKGKQATAAEATENATAKKATTPSEISKNQSEASRNYSEAELDRAKEKQIKSGMLNEDGTPNARFEQMAQSLYNGEILPEDLKREAKGANLDPNQLLGRAMEIGTSLGKPFNLEVAKQENKFATDRHTQAALDGIDRVVGSPGEPGYVDQMLDTARQASLLAGPGMGAANNIVLAARRAFGDTAAKNLQTRIVDTRRSIAGLIGNPLLGGSETDKKLQQADEMLGQSPTMENLEGAAGILKQALQTQKQSIVGNNRYLRTRYGSAGQQPAAAGAVIRITPGEPTAAFPDGTTRVVRGGQWVPAQK